MRDEEIGRPHVRLTLSFPGSPAGYYIYDYAVLVTLD